MELHDPATGRVLPSDAIQRILFICNTVHVYNIPPLTSMRGHNASSWTADPSRHIFTARLRVIETSYESATSSSSSSSATLKVDVVLEDTSTAQLFAAAPYTARAIVEPVLDSSRFFAVTVRDDQGRKAVLGVGFEDRSDAFDLAVALQEAGRSLGWDSEQAKLPGAKEAEATKDYSLKEGETITVNLSSSKPGRRRHQQSESSDSGSGSADLQSFALPPPPGPASGDSGGAFALPPPPSAQSVKEKRRSVRDLGFDDGQFGEFA